MGRDRWFWSTFCEKNNRGQTDKFLGHAETNQKAVQKFNNRFACCREKLPGGFWEIFDLLFRQFSVNLTDKSLARFLTRFLARFLNRFLARFLTRFFEENKNKSYSLQCYPA